MINDPKIFDFLQDQINDLPGEPAHKEMFPSRKTNITEIKDIDTYRTSSVMALLYQTSETKMVLTQRHEYKGKHSGQVSFPGGKMEAEDESILATALRETYEEIGVAPSEIEVIGKLTDVYIPVSKFIVHPFIGYHKDVPVFTKEEKEVKEIFSFDIDELLKEETLQFRNIKSADGYTLKNIPSFIIKDKVVWGATALMLNEIKAILKRI